MMRMHLKLNCLLKWTIEPLIALNLKHQCYLFLLTPTRHEIAFTFEAAITPLTLVGVIFPQFITVAILKLSVDLIWKVFVNIPASGRQLTDYRHKRGTNDAVAQYSSTAPIHYKQCQSVPSSNGGQGYPMDKPLSSG